MLLSVIVCTYCRLDDVRKLLVCLERQTYRDFEVLIVDGNPAPAGDLMELAARFGDRLRLRVVASARGLTRQRNTGLREAAGDVVCFFDDDITFGPGFLGRAAGLLRNGEGRDAAGVTGYDALGYPSPMPLRWRIRRLLGIVPPLAPGNIDRLGRSVPLSFFQPFTGTRRVGFFHGCCMIYRRNAIAGLAFDEQLPTYGGEDRDFSFQAGKRRPLLMCGDLHFEHHYSPAGRGSGIQRVYQTGFGAGRTFRKNCGGALDYLVFLHTLAGEFVVDLLAFAANPSADRWKMPFARLRGSIHGFRSAGSGTGSRDSRGSEAQLAKPAGTD